MNALLRLFSRCLRLEDAVERGNSSRDPTAGRDGVEVDLEAENVDSVAAEAEKGAL